MGVYTSESEITSTVSATRLFKAMVLEANTLMPQILPQAIKSIEIEGDGGPGSTHKTVFAEGLPFSYSKNVVEVLDVENLMYKYSMIEGDVLGEKHEKVTTELKLVTGADGGSVFKSKTEYCTVGDAEVTEEEIEEAKVQGLEAFKAIEAYLLANPHVCN